MKAMLAEMLGAESLRELELAGTWSLVCMYPPCLYMVFVKVPEVGSGRDVRIEV
jgi:hypothetical protein